MKFGFIISKSSHGGGERMQQMLLQEFIKRGHDIVIFTWEDSILNEFTNSLERIILKRQNNKIYQFIYELAKINKELKLLNLDCLIVFGTNESGIIASYFSKTYTISTLRVDPRFPPNKKIKHISRLLLMYLCNGIIFQTAKVRNYFPQKIRRKSIIIPNPVLDDDLPNIKEQKNKSIVAIGRLSEEKNFSMLINAFANLNPDDYALYIYGDGPLKSDLQNLINLLGMQKRIFLEGHVERVIDKIADAKIFVLTSNYEGMPNALIEAMAMGIACISTNFPSGAAEFLIEDGMNGLLIPVNDQNRLEESISMLINDTSFLNKIGNNAFEIRNKLNKENIIKQWLDYIQSITSRKISNL